MIHSWRGVPSSFFSTVSRSLASASVRSTRRSLTVTDGGGDEHIVPNCVVFVADRVRFTPSEVVAWAVAVIDGVVPTNTALNSTQSRFPSPGTPSGCSRPSAAPSAAGTCPPRASRPGCCWSRPSPARPARRGRGRPHSTSSSPGPLPCPPCGAPPADRPDRERRLPPPPPARRFPDPGLPRRPAPLVAPPRTRRPSPERSADPSSLAPLHPALLRSRVAPSRLAPAAHLTSSTGARHGRQRHHSPDHRRPRRVHPAPRRALPPRQGPVQPQRRPRPILEDGDEEIARVREVRHRISERFGHDPHRLVAYYIGRQQEHQDRLVRAPDARTPGGGNGS